MGGGGERKENKVLSADEPSRRTNERLRFSVEFHRVGISIASLVILVSLSRASLHLLVSRVVGGATIHHSPTETANIFPPLSNNCYWSEA